jgi:hypothetical protein
MVIPTLASCVLANNAIQKNSNAFNNRSPKDFRMILDPYIEGENNSTAGNQ